MQYFAKSTEDFKKFSRQQDAALIRKAFPAETQDAIAAKAAKKLPKSKRQIINYLKLQSDMPSYVVKAVQVYVAKVERLAQVIEGQQ